MSSKLSALPPNPSLVAVLLVTRTKAGPNLVFHYPLNPSAAFSSTRLDPAWFGNPSTQLHELSDTDSDHSDETDDDLNHVEVEGGDRGSRAASRISGGRVRHGTGNHGSHRGATASLTSRNVGFANAARDDVDEELVHEDKLKHGQKDDVLDGNDLSHNLVASRLFGFTLDGLSKFLTPSRSFNKRRFEVSLDNLVFLGAPRFAREDGTWRKKKKRSSTLEKRVSASNPGHESDSSREGIGVMTESVENVAPPLKIERREVPLGTTPSSDAGSESRSNASGGSDGDLAMFNLVFVLNPSVLDYQTRVDDMYKHVAKKFSKALKYEQAHSNYVQKESRLISRLKDQAKGQQIHSTLLWPKLIKESSLALALANAFESIANNKIADVALSKAGSSVFKLPQATSTPCLPTSFQPQMPGLWLTTANPDDDEDGDRFFNPHFGLLLLTERELLIQEVESDKKEHSGPLAFFIRNLTPTKSLYRLSQKLSIELKDIVMMARHLIYWRRARAIPPLRPGDIYVVSANADTRKIVSATEAFAARFPIPLPSLPYMLTELSGKARAYKHVIPAQGGYKPDYMSMLAWLMQGGWVTQLRTFGWIQVSPSVKASVAEIDMRQDRKRSDDQSQPSIGSSDPISSEKFRSPSSMSASSVIWSPQNRVKSPGQGYGETLSPHSKALLKSPLSKAEPDTSYLGFSTMLDRSTASTPNSTRTQRYIGDDDKGNKKSSPLRLTRSPSPLNTASKIKSASSINENAPSEPQDTSSYSASLIHSPEKASSQETKWIEHIRDSIKDPETKKLWPVLLRYLDGRHALEIISARENKKKKEIERALANLREEGCLFVVRHW